MSISRAASSRTVQFSRSRAAATLGRPYRDRSPLAPHAPPGRPALRRRDRRGRSRPMTRNVEIALPQPAGADQPSKHKHPRAMILKGLRHGPKAPVSHPNAAKPSPKPLVADGGPLPFEEAQHRRPADLRVEERQQLLQVARLPGEVDASHQLDALGSHLPQCSQSRPRPEVRPSRGLHSPTPLGGRWPQAGAQSSCAQFEILAGAPSGVVGRPRAATVHERISGPTRSSVGRGRPGSRGPRRAFRGALVSRPAFERYGHLLPGRGRGRGAAGRLRRTPARRGRGRRSAKCPLKEVAGRSAAGHVTSRRRPVSTS
jgi:hypothetical protein